MSAFSYRGTISTLYSKPESLIKPVINGHTDLTTGQPLCTCTCMHVYGRFIGSLERLLSDQVSLVGISPWSVRKVTSWQIDIIGAGRRSHRTVEGESAWSPNCKFNQDLCLKLVRRKCAEPDDCSARKKSQVLVKEDSKLLTLCKFLIMRTLPKIVTKMSSA